MNPLRRLAALPLALMLFWAMVVAPAVYARCTHAGGETHLHALGAACDDDAAETVEGKTGNAGGAPAVSSGKLTPGAPAPQPDHHTDCRIYEGDTTASPSAAPTLKTPAPTDLGPAPLLLFAVLRLAPTETIVRPAYPGAPPAPPHPRSRRPALAELRSQKVPEPGSPLAAPW